MSEILIGLFILAGLLVYFTPTIIAIAGHKKNTGAVIIVDVFLGWTFIGWVVAFAMAVSGERESQAQGG